MRPDFDHDEEYLVAYYRHYRKSSSPGSIVQDLATVGVGVAFFCLGYFKDDVTWSVIGFGLVAFRALRGVISGARYNRILAGIVEKYEDALKVDAEDMESEHAAAPSRTLPPSHD